MLAWLLDPYNIILKTTWIGCYYFFFLKKKNVIKSNKITFELHDS